MCKKKKKRKKKKTKRHTYHADLAEPRQETSSVILRKTGYDGSISKSFPMQKDIRYLWQSGLQADLDM